jgi:hypothetical protein
LKVQEPNKKLVAKRSIVTKRMDLGNLSKVNCSVRKAFTVR